MKTITETIKARQTEYDNKQIKPEQKSIRPSEEYILVMLDLFEALARLFQGQCKSQGLEIKDDAGKYTDTFQTWCRKLHEAGIVKADMRAGIKHLEEKKRDSVRTGNEIWPPGYAEFIGHCKAQKERVPLYQRLPPPTLSLEERQKRMDDLRKEFGL